MNKLKKLKQFFIISNSIFNTVNAIQLTLNGYINTNKMQQLHKIALEELNKEKPDLLKIDFLLSEMELLTKNNKNYGC